MKKLINVGFGTLLNEERYCVGWAKTLNFFCKRVVALIDKDTTDKTEERLKKECPFVEIQYQDKSIGDSNDLNQGPNMEMRMHGAQTKFVSENIKNGEWFFALACDERFAADQFNTLYNEIRFAQKHNFDVLRHRYLHEPTPTYSEQIIRVNGKLKTNLNVEIEGKENNIISNYIDYYLKWGFGQPRFIKKREGWTHNLKPHTGYSSNLTPLYSNVVLWHFHKIKWDKYYIKGWRDRVSKEFMVCNNNKIPIVPVFLPFVDFENMPEINNSLKIKIINRDNPELAKHMKDDYDKQTQFLIKQEEDRLQYLEKEKEKLLEDYETQLKTQKELLKNLSNENIFIKEESLKILTKKQQNQIKDLTDEEELFEIIKKQAIERLNFEERFNTDFEKRKADIVYEVERLEFNIKMKKREK